MNGPRNVRADRRTMPAASALRLVRSALARAPDRAHGQALAAAALVAAVVAPRGARQWPAWRRRLQRRLRAVRAGRRAARAAAVVAADLQAAAVVVGGRTKKALPLTRKRFLSRMVRPA